MSENMLPNMPPPNLKPIQFDENLSDQLAKYINTPEYQNYAANQMQNNLLKNLSTNNTTPIKSDEERLHPVTDKMNETNSLIKELQEKLSYANSELKQANNKIASQTLYIKELNADIKEEITKRAKAEDELSKKDKKVIRVGIISSLATAIIILLIEYIFVIPFFNF